MDTLSKIPIIGFDGLHRSGKGTEIDLLTNFLTNEGYTPIVLKGHGTRDGLGIEKGDPSSERWRINSPKLRDRKTPNYKELRREAAERLQTELSDTYKALQTRPEYNPDNKPVILLDRTVFSRYFTEKQFDNEFGFDRTLQFTHTSDEGIKEVQATIIPDLIFVLKCSRKTLNNRFTAKELATEKGRFRKKNVNKTFKLFRSIIKDMPGHSIPKEIQDKVHIINGNRTRPEIHQDVKDIIMRILPSYYAA